jgi:hypothetical protein
MPAHTWELDQMFPEVNYPMYTQFGEFISYVRGFRGAAVATASELAEIAFSVTDTPEKECSRSKSSTKGRVFGFGPVFEKPVPSG